MLMKLLVLVHDVLNMARTPVLVGGGSGVGIVVGGSGVGIVGGDRGVVVIVGGGSGIVVIVVVGGAVGKCMMFGLYLVLHLCPLFLIFG
jgi:hypothetical protein